jgi:K+-transporting ATPase ATPase B chain
VLLNWYQTGMKERFERLRKWCKTVMVTGDNPLTAKFIAEAAGVDDLLPKPNLRIKNNIKNEQEQGKQ